MTKAIIIFADGSKQMAHNLDDLRLRWHERKLEQADAILDAYKNSIAIRDCSLPKDYEQASLWFKEMTDQKATLAQYLVHLKAVIKPAALNRKAPHLKAAYQEAEKQYLYLKSWFHDHPDDGPRGSRQFLISQELRREVDQLRADYIAAQTKIIQLQKILLDQFGITMEDA